VHQKCTEVEKTSITVLAFHLRIDYCILLGMVEGERQPGRPARRWIDDVLMWCGKDIKVAVTMTEDRDNWRRFVSTGQPLRSPCVTTGFGKEKNNNVVNICILCVLYCYRFMSSISAIRSDAVHIRVGSYWWAIWCSYISTTPVMFVHKYCKKAKNASDISRYSHVRLLQP